MRAKPKTHLALRRAVQFVKPELVEGGLDAVDRLLLNCLTEAAPNANGEGSHPGNTNLCAAVGLRQSSMLARVEKLISKELIQRTQVGDGRKHASVYRICWWHLAYPDHAPGGLQESFIEEEKQSGDGPDSLPKSASRKHSGAGPDSFSGNIPVETGKHSGADAETFRPSTGNIPAYGPEDNNKPTKNQPTIQPNRAPETGADGRAAFVANLPANIAREIPLLGPKDDKALCAAISKHGQPLMTATFNFWITPGVRPYPVEGIKQLKLRVFLKEYQSYIEQVRADLLEQTPEGRAAKQAQEEAAIRWSEEYSRKAMEKAYGPRDQESTEQTLEETEAMLKEISKPGSP